MTIVYKYTEKYTETLCDKYTITITDKYTETLYASIAYDMILSLTALSTIFHNTGLV